MTETGPAPEVPETVNWRTVAAISVTCLGPVAILWFADRLSLGCGAIEVAAKPWGCGEFLLNRYQTLIAAGFAFLIAWFAARPVFQQIAEMRRQNAVSARQISLELAASLDREREGVVDYYLGIELDMAVLKEEVEAGFLEVPVNLPPALRELRKAIIPYVRRGEGSAKLIGARRPAYAQCANLTGVLDDVLTFSEGHSLRPDAAKVREAIEIWYERWDDYRQVLIRDRRDALGSAKRYEAIVHAGF